MENQYHTSLSDKLLKTGLSEKESAVYAFLLECDGAFPSLIAKNTKLNRTTVYKILTGLSIKGLVTEYEKRKKLFYRAEHPKYLTKYAESQIVLAKRANEHLEKMMPLLEGIYKNSPDKPVMRFYEGIEGVRAVYNDQIQTQKSYEMMAFSNTVQLLPQLDSEFKKNYVKQKIKLGISTRAIVPSAKDAHSNLLTFYQTAPKNLIPKIKHLPLEVFTFSADMTLYGENKVSIINFNEPNFVGTIIEDVTIYNMMKLFFDLTWSSLDR